MKYCVIGPTYPFRGGIAHFTTLLVRHLRQSHPVDFYSYRRQYPRWLFPGNAEADPSRSVLEEPCERTIDALNPLSWWRTARQMVTRPPDVLILQWWTPFWWPLSLVISLAARRDHIPIVYLCHQLVGPDSMNKRLIDGIERLLVRGVLSLADGIILLTESDYAVVKRAFPTKRIRKGHLPIFELPRQQITRAEARARLGIDASSPLLLFFGFVRRYKGLRYLLQALALLPPAIRLLIAGEFWEEKKEYVDLIHQLGLDARVLLHDRYIPNEQVEAYFVAADALILPYVAGSHSGAGMIALHYGLPMIATETGGHGETIVDGETGLIVPAGDSRALASAIQRFYDQELAGPFRAKMASLQERVSWDALIRIVEELSCELCATKASAAAELLDGRHRETL